MARKSEIIEIFISGPSDIAPEKAQIIATISEWNATRSRDAQVFFSPLTWEEVVTSTVSGRPQGAINEQIGNDYDVYLGVMWSRFGAPTGVSESGTVEEFDRALERFKSGEGIRLAMLFSMAPIHPSNLDGEQFAKVQEFKKRFASEGGLYKEFSDHDSLRISVTRLLEDIVRSRSGRVVLGNVDHDVNLSEVNLAADGDNHEELGLFDFQEKLDAIVHEQGKFFDKLTAQSDYSNSVMAKASAAMEALTSVGQATPDTIKPLLKEISRSMDDMSSFIEKDLPSFKEGGNELLEITIAGLDIAGDFGTDKAAARLPLISAIRGVVSTLSVNVTSTSDLIDTTSSLPRLSSEFNKSRRRFEAAQGALLDQFIKLRDGLSVALVQYGG